MKDKNLNEDWALQSSADLKVDGATLSTSNADITGWYRTELPATVLGTLVESGAYEDPFFGKNLEAFPGQGPKAENFSNHSMPDDSPFKKPWWYRKTFSVSSDAGSHLSLQLDGINYRANIWLNGKKIADAQEIIGAYRDFELDITASVDRSGENVLAIEIFPPRKGDIAITWVDWNPSPADKNMGIWRDVWLKSSGPVQIRAPHVITKLEGIKQASLRVACDLANVSDVSQAAEVDVEIDGHKIKSIVQLKPFEKRRYEETIQVDSPRLWWPRFMGEQALYKATLKVQSADCVSDSTNFNFGIREVVSELTKDGHSLFKINGEPVLIRGAGWATDLFLRRQPDRDLAQLEYVKAMNLNTIRFEGMLERASFLEWCDKEGILVISGWSCCDSWEMWDEWTDEHVEIAKESLRSQIRRSRRHPSLISWWYGSDFSPPEHVERCYLDVLKEEDWPNACHSSAADKPTEITGSSGLKMEGPYDYVPPNYWLEDKERGGAFGFATEICPGPAVPPIESLRKMMPKENLWPINDMWNFHSGGQEFHNIDIFKDALNSRYGECDSAEQFAEYSQLVTYESQRAMFEAYARNKFKSTGVIQWMLNNSWPSLIWHLYDYYLRPAGGYFATKKACEPLHVMFATDDRSVVVTNEYTTRFEGLRVKVDVLSLDSSYLISRTETVNVDALGTTKVFDLPYLDGVSPIYFIDLQLSKRDGEPVSHNFYWVAAKQDVLDHEKGSWINTPIETPADLTGLRALPETQLDINANMERHKDGVAVKVKLENSQDKVAFFVETRLSYGNGEDVVPLDWSDNYISILPGNSCILTANAKGVPADADLCLHVSGVNVPSMELKLGKGNQKKEGESAQIGQKN